MSGDAVTPDALAAQGWTLLTGTHFNEAAGPYWLRPCTGGHDVGLLSEARHGNGHVGTVHGGVLMTFADIALGIGVVDAAGTRNCVTLHLQLQFTATARIGSFLSCRAELVRRTSQIVFMRGLIVAGDRVVASADGMWKLVDADKLAALKRG
ncbi:PaaI family thioesterase [Sphingomonas ginsenosidivorax]|uniref:PaaI family thioesterase n=1 Tax=Sphingomonas ginsenosidivorax TaxID=862135 RepID=A0A5C6UC94_9SPHN|nr:PaaI family thioesterase [Sphingomonas ginsenosidivorax]TXC70274.1 PaaI family thioesterase [Sphingomonas ginsenosidivorax]